MANIAKSIGLTGDVVSSMTMVETAITGIFAGVANQFIGGMVPSSIPGPLVNLGEVAGGLAVKSAIGGKAGLIAGNALTITGAVGLGQVAASAIMGLFGGNMNSGADTAESSALVY